MTNTMLSQQQFYDLLTANNGKIKDKSFDSILLDDSNLGATRSIDLENCNFNVLFIKTTFAINIKQCKLNELKIHPRGSKATYISIHDSSGKASAGFDLSLVGNCYANFNNCIIQTLKLDNAPILFVNFDKCKFDNVTTNGTSSLSLNNIRFENTTFYDLAGLDEAKINNETTFIKCSFESLKNEAVFRNFKKKFSEHSNEIESDFFAAYELKSKHHNTKFEKDFPNWLIGSLYRVINNFGLSPYRPAIYLLCTSILIFASSYLGCLIFVRKDAFVFIIGPFKYFNESMRYSLTVSDYAAFGLSLLSSTLWFFLIIGIRKRFKISH